MVSNFALDNGFEILDLDFSPIKGPEGNIEYLIHLKSIDKKQILDEQEYIDKVKDLVEKSHMLDK